MSDAKTPPVPRPHTDKPFTGHPFCERTQTSCAVCGPSWEGPQHTGSGVHVIDVHGCIYAAGHSCPCRFTRRLP